MSEINFGYGGEETVYIQTPDEKNSEKEDSGVKNESLSEEDIKNLDENEDKDKQVNEENNNRNSGEIPHDIKEGTVLEIGNDSYTVDKNGNILDKDGNIFKEAKDVKEWLKEFEEETEEDKELTIENIQKQIGITITDENDKPVEFENTIEGITSYVNAVVDAKKEEHYQTALDILFDKYPILEDVLNYYTANNNSLEGFNEQPDRSEIVIDENNEEQQELIIKTAWREQDRKGDVEGYIKYLKTSGQLFTVANEELKGIQELDKQRKEAIKKQAEEKEAQQIKDLETYWNGIHEVIKSRQIAGYRIPENIEITKDGKKLHVTPENFFDYIYRVDKDGRSAYDKDLEKQTPESRRDDLILRAYLTFVGGNYSNLVDMAINKKEVDTLKFKAKERKTNTIRYKTPSTSKKEIDFGY